MNDDGIPLMNRKILLVCMAMIAIGLILIASLPQPTIFSAFFKNTGNMHYDKDYVEFTTMNEGKKQSVIVLKKDLIFNTEIINDKNNIHPKYVNIEKKPELSNFYKQVASANEFDAVFVYPIFTQGAYGEHGFYNYYNKTCDTKCLTLAIPSRIIPIYSSSMSISLILPLLNYSRITDVDIDKNPDILKKYHKVIVLHNEYVTKVEFYAITSHPNVIYLFPNALYAEVKTNYTDNTFTLIKGHGYPTSSITNGFDWKLDNSDLEYNTMCKNLTFETISNGKMLNCYPAYRGLFDKSFLEAIKKS
ncbi:MAG: hypothetical protein ACYC6W_06345 [Nitrosotalea sp.]